MLKKLNSALKNPVLRLTLKATVVTGLLYLSVVGRRLFVIGYLAAAFYFYFKPFFGSKRRVGSFFVFLIVSLLAMSQLVAIAAPLKLMAAIILGMIFFFFLGAKNMVFINQPVIFDFINNFLFFLVFAVFFMADKSSWFLIKYSAAFAAIFLLFWEFVALQELRTKAEISAGPIFAKKNLFSASFSVLISQFMLATSYLPIGFLNASALCLVAVLCLKDLAINHFHGSLDRTVVLRNASLAVIFSLLIFAASKWQP